jgi:hypothetical protein
MPCRTFHRYQTLLGLDRVSRLDQQLDHRHFLEKSPMSGTFTSMSAHGVSPDDAQDRPGSCFQFDRVQALTGPPEFLVEFATRMRTPVSDQFARRLRALSHDGEHRARVQSCGPEPMRPEAILELEHLAVASRRPKMPLALAINTRVLARSRTDRRPLPWCSGSTDSLSFGCKRTGRCRKPRRGCAGSSSSWRQRTHVPCAAPGSAPRRAGHAQPARIARRVDLEHLARWLRSHGPVAFHRT